MLKKILIADDEPFISHSLARYLQTRPCETLTVQDGQQALNLIQCTAFDLVILDLNMPKYDGIEVLQHMRTWGHDTDVFILTGYGTLQLADLAIQMHIKRFLTKPITYKKFIKAVDQTLNFDTDTTYDLAKRMEAYMRTHFSNSQLTYQHLLTHFNISKTYAFKVLTNHLKPFTALLTDMRLSHAKTLLRTTTMRINEVSETCGFTSPQRFSHVFHHQEGLTPTQYRAKNISKTHHNL